MRGRFSPKGPAVPSQPHQYVDRRTGQIRTERLFADRIVRWLYSPIRERAPRLFHALVSRRASGLLGFFNFDVALGRRLAGAGRFLHDLGVDLDECLDPPASLNTPRKVFERRIRYWDVRPMPDDPRVVVAPADARALVGSFRESSQIAIKDKFFSFEELLGNGTNRWTDLFRDGDFAVFRLTPDKYHYNHVPAAGRVADFYQIEGVYHSCNPHAVIAVATPYSKNKRVVTIIDTDVPGGSSVGLVAMVEVVALMVGEIVQCYSEHAYDDPRDVRPGMFLQRGAPKSLFRPGSSTTVLLFQPGRVEFAEDLVANMFVQAATRFSQGFGRPLVETDVRVRSVVARASNSR